MGKHFLTILGTSNYKDTIYYCENREYQTPYIQEAVLKLKLDSWEPGDKITVFVTQEAIEKNWKNRLYTEREKELAKKTGEPLPEIKTGLKEVLDREYAPYVEDIQVSTIPLGANEEELWDIFQVIYSRIMPEEELYIDITHAMRNIPIQMLAVISYARVVKNVTVEGIYYGAFEAGHKNEEGIMKAPVFDLITFLNILDWSQAANAFVRYGNSDQIKDLYREESKKNNLKQPELKKIVGELQNITHGLETSRGYVDIEKMGEFKNGKSVLASYKQYQETYKIMMKKDGKVRESQKKQKHQIEPLGELFDVINKKVELFDVSSNLEFGLAGTQWAIENNQTQQGFTALEETVKTYLCSYYDLDEKTEKTRDHICKGACNRLNWAMAQAKVKEADEKFRKQVVEEWKKSQWSRGFTEEEQEIYGKIVMEIPEEMAEICKQITNRRNSMNHFGYSNIKQFSCDGLAVDLKNYYEKFIHIMSIMEERKGKK